MHTGPIARWFGRGSPRRGPRLSERLFNRFALIYYGRNLALDLQLAAKRESVKYIQRHMRQAMLVRDRWDLLDFALSRAPAEGMILEFGVERGDSLRHLSRRTDRTVHGFDSFQGLPEDWHGTFEKRGKFSTAGRLPAGARGWVRARAPRGGCRAPGRAGPVLGRLAAFPAAPRVAEVHQVARRRGVPREHHRRRPAELRDRVGLAQHRELGFRRARRLAIAGDQHDRQVRIAGADSARHAEARHPPPPPHVPEDEGDGRAFARARLGRRPS